MTSSTGDAGEKGDKGAPGRPGRVGPTGEKGTCCPWAPEGTVRAGTGGGQAVGGDSRGIDSSAGLGDEAGRREGSGSRAPPLPPRRRLETGYLLGGAHKEVVPAQRPSAASPQPGVHKGAVCDCSPCKRTYAGVHAASGGVSRRRCVSGDGHKQHAGQSPALSGAPRVTPWSPVYADWPPITGSL